MLFVSEIRAKKVENGKKNVKISSKKNTQVILVDVKLLAEHDPVVKKNSKNLRKSRN